MNLFKYITSIVLTLALFGCAKNELTDLTLPENPYVNNEGLPGALISNAFIVNTGSSTIPYKTIIEYKINPDYLLIPNLTYIVELYKNGNFLGAINQSTKSRVDLKVYPGGTYKYEVQLVYSDEQTTPKSDVSTLVIPN